MKRKFVITAFVLVMLASPFLLTSFVPRLKMIGRTKETTEKVSEDISFKKAIEMFPNIKLDNSKKYSISYVKKITYSFSGVKVDTLGKVTLLESDL